MTKKELQRFNRGNELNFLLENYKQKLIVFSSHDEKQFEVTVCSLNDENQVRFSIQNINDFPVKKSTINNGVKMMLKTIIAELEAEFKAL